MIDPATLLPFGAGLLAGGTVGFITCAVLTVGRLADDPAALADVFDDADQADRAADLAEWRPVPARPLRAIAADERAAAQALGALIPDDAWQHAGLDQPPLAEIATCHRRALALEAAARQQGSSE